VKNNCAGKGNDGSLKKVSNSDRHDLAGSAIFVVPTSISP